MFTRTEVIQKLIHFNEKLIFYPKLKKFYSQHIKDKAVSIIDVGSNKGQSIDFFSGINKNAIIFGFEPNKKLYAGLQKKYSGNANISLINKGISNKEGSLVFHENIMDETSTFENLNYKSDYLKKKAKVLGVSADKIIVDSYEVEVTTLQNFISLHGQTFFEVLKIDVEGHELQSLEGLFMNNTGSLPVRFIQIESHNDDMYQNNDQKHKIDELLQANNFVQVAKIRHGFGDFHEIIYENKNL